MAAVANAEGWGEAWRGGGGSGRKGVVARCADDVFPQREGSAIVGSWHSIAVGQGSSSVDPVPEHVRATTKRFLTNHCVSEIYILESMGNSSC